MSGEQVGGSAREAIEEGLPQPQGRLGIGDLPLREINPAGTKLVIFCDVSMDQELKFKADEVFAACADGRYMDLPETLRLRAEPRLP